MLYLMIHIPCPTIILDFTPKSLHIKGDHQIIQRISKSQIFDKNDPIEPKPNASFILFKFSPKTCPLNGIVVYIFRYFHLYLQKSIKK